MTTKLARTENYVSEMINDDDEMMKIVEIKFAFAFLFQNFKFQEKFENSKQSLKKRTFTENLIIIIRNDAPFNKLKFFF